MNHVEATTGHETDPKGVNHPAHYNRHPSGVEAIEVCRHLGFNLGSAFKYVIRKGLKESAEKDLRKALWYVEDEMANRKDDHCNPLTNGYLQVLGLVEKMRNAEEDSLVKDVLVLLVQSNWGSRASLLQVRALLLQLIARTPY